MGLGEMTVNFRVPFAPSVSPILMPRNVVVFKFESERSERRTKIRYTCLPDRGSISANLLRVDRVHHPLVLLLCIILCLVFYSFILYLMKHITYM